MAEFPSPPQTFTYRDWAGHQQTVWGVAFVEFTAAHVVFKDKQRRIILAERVEHVNRLSQQDVNDDAAATRRLENPQEG